MTLPPVGGDIKQNWEGVNSLDGIFPEESIPESASAKITSGCPMIQAKYLCLPHQSGYHRTPGRHAYVAGGMASASAVTFGHRREFQARQSNKSFHVRLPGSKT